MNRKKMRGFIDPYTLGFLISILGSSTAFLLNEDDAEVSAESQQIVSTDAKTDAKENPDAK